MSHAGRARLSKRWCAALLTMFILLSTPAFAQSFGEGFSCSGATANGVLYDNGRTCTFGINSFITGTLCNYEKILGQVVGKMFCQMQNATLGPLQKLITLYIIIFAVQFSTGMVQFTAGEAFMHLIKIALIWTAATEAEFTIGIVYSFFMNFAHEGTKMALSAWGDGSFSDAHSAFNYLDRSFSQSHLAKYASGEKSLSTFALLIMLVIPPLAFMVGYYVIKAIKVFARALLGFALAITGIAFLTIVFSLFLGLALFRPTQPFFEKCVHYMASFSFQMVIVFAFIAMMHSFPLNEFFTQLNDLVVDYGVGWSIGPFKLDLFNMPTLCTAEVYSDGTMSCVPGPDPQDCGPDSSGRPRTCTPIPWMSLMQQIPFIKFVLIKLMALMAVVYAFEMFQENAPEMAKQLAGPRYAARLGGITPSTVSLSASRIPLFGAETIDEATTGFKRGWDQAGGSTFNRALAGFQQASAAFQASAREEASTWSLGLPDEQTRRANNPGYVDYLMYKRRTGQAGG